MSPRSGATVSRYRATDGTRHIRGLVLLSRILRRRSRRSVVLFRPAANKGWRTLPLLKTAVISIESKPHIRALSQSWVTNTMYSAVWRSITRCKILVKCPYPCRTSGRSLVINVTTWPACHILVAFCLCTLGHPLRRCRHGHENRDRVKSSLPRTHWQRLFLMADMEWKDPMR